MYILGSNSNFFPPRNLLSEGLLLWLDHLLRVEMFPPSMYFHLPLPTSILYSLLTSLPQARYVTGLYSEVTCRIFWLSFPKQGLRSRTQRLFQEVLRGGKLEGQSWEVWKKQERKRGLGVLGGQDFGKPLESGWAVQK